MTRFYLIQVFIFHQIDNNQILKVNLLTFESHGIKRRLELSTLSTFVVIPDNTGKWRPEKYLLLKEKGKTHWKKEWDKKKMLQRLPIFCYIDKPTASFSISDDPKVDESRSSAQFSGERGRVHPFNNKRFQRGTHKESELTRNGQCNTGLCLRSLCKKWLKQAYSSKTFPDSSWLEVMKQNFYLSISLNSCAESHYITCPRFKKFLEQQALVKKKKALFDLNNEDSLINLSLAQEQYYHFKLNLLSIALSFLYFFS